MPNKDFQNGIIVGLSSRSVNNITEENYTLVSTITADGTQNSYTVNLNNAKNCYVVCSFTIGSAASNIRNIFYNGANEVGNFLNGQINNSATRYHSAKCYLEHGLWFCGGRVPSANDGFDAWKVTAECPPKTKTDYAYITSVMVKSQTATVMIPSGSKIYVYAY